MGILQKNWKLLAALAGVAVASSLWQRQHEIDLKGKLVGNISHAGRDSETPLTRSFVTSLGQRASQEYNENPPE